MLSSTKIAPFGAARGRGCLGGGSAILMSGDLRQRQECANWMATIANHRALVRPRLGGTTDPGLE